MTPREAEDHLLQFVKSVDSMRNAQRKYFTTRSREDLITAKKLEKEIDKWLEQFAL